MRGFALGSLGLIALYVLLQHNSVEAVGAGGNILAQGARRLLAADVAGIPQLGGFPRPSGTTDSAAARPGVVQPPKEGTAQLGVVLW